MIRLELTPTLNTPRVHRPGLALAVGDQEEVLNTRQKYPQKNYSPAFSTEALGVVVARSMGLSV